MRSRELVVLLVAGLLGPGCTAITDFGHFTFDDGGAMDAGGGDGGPDVGPRDGGPDVGPHDGGPDMGGSDAGDCPMGCTPTETCCAGTCTDVHSDLANCGMCGHACPTGPNATPSCGGGACALACTGEFGDCDTNPGCETDLHTTGHCGACGTSCTGTQVCGGAVGARTCMDTCGTGQTNCSGTCADLTSDVSNCSACGMACPDLFQTARSCSSSTCHYACNPGYLDCNGDLGTATSDGCETERVAYYPDRDGDGYGVLGTPMYVCPGTMGYATMLGDCDDTSPTVHPGATERCNGADDDCNAVTDDGFDVGMSCSCVTGSAAGTRVCSSTTMTTCAYPAEACNGLDDDCDGAADDGFACRLGSTQSCTVSGCVGTQTCVAGCMFSACTPPAETCDGFDQDCDGFVDDGALGLGARITLLPTGGIVRSAWRDAAHGGAMMFMIDDATAMTRTLYFSTFSATGALTGSVITLAVTTYADVGMGLGANLPYGLGWDGMRWATFHTFGISTSPYTVEVRHRGVDPTTGTASAATAIATTTGIGPSFAVAGNGSLGIAVASSTAVRVGIWANGAFTTALRATPLTGTFLDQIQITPASTGNFVVGTGDVQTGSTHAIRTMSFNAASNGTVVNSFAGGADEIDSRLAYDAGTGRVLVTYRESGTGNPYVGSIDPVGATAAIGPVRMPAGTPAEMAATNGELYVAGNPSLFRVRASDVVPFPESYGSVSYCYSLLPTPGASQRLLCFGADSFGQYAIPISCP